MAWVVWWRGVGQVVREGQVTLGYLLSRESTSGGHCEVGGGSGELAGGGVVVQYSALGLVPILPCAKYRIAHLVLYLSFLVPSTVERTWSCTYPSLCQVLCTLSCTYPSLCQAYPSLCQVPYSALGVRALGLVPILPCAKPILPCATYRIAHLVLYLSFLVPSTV
jgi:hypothetical protein